ncbi:piggyBac transposable element-derived protein 3-like [Watersipora subatra]|uniref:piggyBac transposable element-derived protein 3-like n=1 Tax=Watersipora subatra TaxID=2589382 RepID=UPI00355B541E
MVVTGSYERLREGTRGYGKVREVKASIKASGDLEGVLLCFNHINSYLCQILKMDRSRRKRIPVHNILDLIDGDFSDYEDIEDSDDDEDFDPQQQDGLADDSNSSDEDEDEVPLNKLRPAASNQTTRQTTPQYRWRKKDFVTTDAAYSGDPIEPPTDIASPLLYFKRFVTTAMLNNVVVNTNLYSVQKNGKSVNTSLKEVEQFIGMFFHMGLIRMNSVRQYWGNESAYEPVCQIMSRNRFQSLVYSLHFVDNMSVSEDEKRQNKVWKLRPWLDAMRENCLAVTPCQHCAVDEMMVPYQGKRSPIRQYIKGKPHPWGFKIWGRCGVDGLLFDFDVYQGGDGQRSELGQGADVVLKLTSTLPSGKSYKVFADNLFTSVPLLIKLQEHGIYYTGTVRQNRLAGCTLTDEKSLKKRGRGAYDWKVEENSNIAAVRWYDNRGVTLLSTETAVQCIL